MQEDIGPDGKTAAQRHAEWAADAARYKARFADRKACDYHTRCRDCGVFVIKPKWVKKDAFNAIQRQQRPLCGACFDEYETIY